MFTSVAPKVPTGAGKLLKADLIADQFRFDIQNTISTITRSSFKKPKLVGILAVSASKPSETYAEFTKKTCEALGVEYVLKKVGEEISEGGSGSSAAEDQGSVEDAIIEANADDSVGGIMVGLLCEYHRQRFPILASCFRSTIPSSEAFRIIIFSKLVLRCILAISLR
jgi:hypothetical protein